MAARDADMAFLTHSNGGRGQARAEINMIPLIDVMLVLLVIFMITAPLLTHAVKLDLPRASSRPPQASNKVSISIDAQGHTFWDGKEVADGEIEPRLQALAATQPTSEIHLYADKAARYEWVAGIVTAASRAGLSRIGFITQPGHG